MIIYSVNNMKIYETRSDAPSGDFTGGRAEFVIDECEAANVGLIRDIKRLAPFFIPVLGEGGELVGVTDDAEARAAFEATKEPDPEPIPEGNEPVTWDELAKAYQEGVNSIDE